VDGPSRLILHVDDDEATRYAVARMLERAGHRVIPAADGAAALRLLDAGPDLVLLDIRLPDTTGFELCRHVRSRPGTARLPVAFLSARYFADEDEAYGRAVGGDAFLVHPVDPAALLQTVERLTSAPPARPAPAERRPA
jgi:CheY-like chemotaxis protein